ncbi:MAG: MipA/OmpV family protein [Deltaproteobacteria bacterium]|jgi:outer membrane scaffolding protein for murein synthesis (MipA/OmpV family)|nr:MipA/OmpV family protein [Deltaproteobacteria bacterium]
MPYRTFFWLAAAMLAAALALRAGPCPAQVMDTGEGGGTTVTGSVGAGVVYAPDFYGANDNKVSPMPFLNLRYGPVFLSTDKGLGVRIDLFDGALEISPAVNYRWRRDEGDSEVLRGMGDVDGQLTGGASVIYRIDDVSFGVKGFQGLSDDKGFTLDMRLAYLNRMSDVFRWGLAAEAGFADADYNQTHFGVTPLQSLRSGYPVYTPSAGLKDLSLGGSVDYYLTPSFSVDVFAKFTRLTGDAADSPLVLRGGSPNQVATGLMFFYHFGGY